MGDQDSLMQDNVVLILQTNDSHFVAVAHIPKEVHAKDSFLFQYQCAHVHRSHRFIKVY